MEAVSEWLAVPGYEVGRWVLQRGIAVTYVLAFLNVFNQFPALLGERGLLPFTQVVARSDFRSNPSLLHWRGDDATVRVVAVGGMALAAAMAIGLGDWLPLPLAVAAWLVLWFAYLSIVNVGRVFYGFGWESLLLEVGFLVAFLGNDDVAPTIVVLWLARWVLFRVEFGAGLIKMRGDPCWRDLTCLHHHHETQPMPNPASWWFHHLPGSLHKVEVAANHVAQLGLPWLLFLPQPVAGFAAVLIVVTQAWLMLSGNYAWLNFVTLLLGLAVVPDSFLLAVQDVVDGVVAVPAGWGIDAIIPAIGRDVAATPTWWAVVVLAVAVLLVVLSWQPARNLVAPGQRMNASFNRWHLVNAYGAFGSVTKARREVVIEGSIAADPGPADWQAFEFRGKPTDPLRRPRQWAPYHLRLDWLLWFVALSPGYGAGWFDRLCNRLHTGDEATLALLARNPFPDHAPTWLRVRLVDYRFSTREERRRTGAWWVTGRSRDLVTPRRRHVEAATR